jgi:hypothetical protein
VSLEITGGGRDIVFAEDLDKVRPRSLEVRLGDIMPGRLEVCKGGGGGAGEGGGLERSEVVSTGGEEDQSYQLRQGKLATFIELTEPGRGFWKFRISWSYRTS